MSQKLIETGKEIPLVINTKHKYWYITEYTVCVLCGSTSILKYRVYEKPQSSIKHIDHACPEHFFG